MLFSGGSDGAGEGLDISPDFAYAASRMEEATEPIFVTGRAGTGKSTLLEYWRRKTSQRVAVLAPTGVAALNVGGVTIHSFFGFKPDITVEKARKGGRKRDLVKILAGIDAIVIDEISMVRADLMDCIDASLRKHAGRRHTPFGGKRMIFIGDLYQLPPVVSRDQEEYVKTRYASPYFFAADVFREFEPPERIELGKVYRQKDGEFVSLLDAIRAGRATRQHLEQLNRLVRPQADAAADWITLTTTNQRAALVNEARLGAISGKEATYPARVEGAVAERDFPTEHRLALKVGAQVMMVNNDMQDRWVNGTLGHIIDIVHGGGEDDAVRVQLANGRTVDVLPHAWEVSEWTFDEEKGEPDTRIVGQFRQYPMKLAWAVTIHKSQGKTFDRVVVDVSGGIFAHGQLYVALSRCRTFEGMVLRCPVRARDLIVDDRVIRFMQYEPRGPVAARPRQETFDDIVRVQEQDAWLE
ncbi:MAG: hypothetical protein RL272_790 [Candidatus Parcubacteria bacterium]|jgi:ATP-dependent exoDNAse (exonuclease V) alpha subunit